MTSNVIAVVTARAGSKGLPKKNQRLLGGHPLIAWSVLAARASTAVDRVICTTDCEALAAIAQSYGAEIPFLRPTHLADDTATDLGVFDHIIRFLGLGYEPDSLIIHLRPTTPFREPTWIDQACAKLRASADVSSVRSVTPVDHSPYKMWRHDEAAGLIVPLLDVPGLHEPFNQPRQLLPTVYRHTGQLDVIRASVIASGSMTGTQIAPLFVSAETAIDIDNLNDFRFAELMFETAMAADLRRMASADLKS